MVSQAIELNEQLGRVLAKHAALVSDVPASTVNSFERPSPILNTNNHIINATWASKPNNHAGSWATSPNKRPDRPTSSPNHINHTNLEETDEEEEAAQLSHR